MHLSQSRTARLMVLGTALVGVAAAVVCAQPSRDPKEFASTQMRQDANADGKLDKSEVNARFLEVFDAADTNGDGFLVQAELEAFHAARFGGRANGRNPGPRAAGGDDEAFHEAMENAGRSVRQLRRSPMDATSAEADLQAVQRLQAALIEAKATLSTVDMAPQAREKYADDVDAYHKDFRMTLIEAIGGTLEFEKALLAGDAEASKAAFGAVRAIQGAGHDAFQDDDH